MRSVVLLGLVVGGLVLSVTPCVQGVTYSFASGNYAAEATFTVSGTNLIIQLTNTSTADVMAPSDVLTGVFFDLAGNLTLTPISAVLASGSTVLFDSQPASGVVGGEWAYQSWSTDKGTGGTHQGVSSTGLDLFGPEDRFPGDDLDSPVEPNGLNYGLTSAGDDPTTGNKKVKGKEPLIQSSVIFTLGGLTVDFDPTTDITNVWFQYGTDLCEPSYAGTMQEIPPVDLQAPVPEPITAMGLMLGAAAVARYVRRRKK